MSVLSCYRLPASSKPTPWPLPHHLLPTPLLVSTMGYRFHYTHLAMRIPIFATDRNPLVTTWDVRAILQTVLFALIPIHPALVTRR